MIEKYIITSAVTNSPVFQEGLDTLENFCKIENATLIVLPITYNPLRLEKQYLKIDEALEGYIKEDNFSINDLMTVLPEINIRPTAVKPLQGLASMGHETHTVIAHPRLHLKTIPTMNRYEPKFILTTGIITKDNYTRTKTGAKAKFHHTHGAVVVEVDSENEKIFFRQVSIDSEGHFYDINKKYTQYSAELVNQVEAIDYGDIHVPFVADVVKDKGFFGTNSLARLCKPKYTILHDLLDQYTQSHHNEKSHFRKYKISSEGMTIIDEINFSKEFVKDVLDLNTIPVIISSNHNSHLTQWIERANWQNHMGIAKDVLKLQLKMLEEIDSIDNIDLKVPDLFRLLMIEEFGDNIIALDYNENFRLKDFELGLHGDKGLNGARATGNLHNHINVKIIKAHSHSAERIDGLRTVGTSSELDRGYTFGLSTWSHTHAIIHDNGKDQLITQNSYNGEFRLDEVANSKGKLVADFDKQDYEAHFISYDDEVAKEDGMKYKIVDTKTDSVYYATSYRHMSQVLDIGTGVAQTLMEKGEHNNYFCEKL